MRERLQAAVKKALEAEKEAQRFVDERDDLIIEANEDGASLREIAEAIGLSHMGVSKAIKRRREQAATESQEKG